MLKIPRPLLGLMLIITAIVVLVITAAAIVIIVIIVVIVVIIVISVVLIIIAAVVVFVSIFYNSNYKVECYLNNGGATVDFAVLCKVIDNKNKKEFKC